MRKHMKIKKGIASYKELTTAENKGNRNLYPRKQQDGNGDYRLNEEADKLTKKKMDRKTDLYPSRI